VISLGFSLYSELRQRTKVKAATALLGTHPEAIPVLLNASRRN
jgi:hypothetical protein